MITALYVFAGLAGLFFAVCTAMEWVRIATERRSTQWPQWVLRGDDP